MKKYNKILFVIIVIFTVLLFAGAILAFVSPDSFSEAAFNTIMLLVSGGSIIVALMAQSSAEHSRRISERIIRNIYDIDKNLDADAAVDRSIRYKLDKIMIQNEKIYEKLGGDMEKFRTESSTAARAKQQEYRKKSNN